MPSTMVCPLGAVWLVTFLLNSVLNGLQVRMELKWGNTHFTCAWHWYDSVTVKKMLVKRKENHSKLLQFKYPNLSQAWADAMNGEGTVTKTKSIVQGISCQRVGHMADKKINSSEKHHWFTRKPQPTKHRTNHFRPHDTVWCSHSRHIAWQSMSNSREVFKCISAWKDQESTGTFPWISSSLQQMPLPWRT